jgi:hypothetical protein
MTTQNWLDRFYRVSQSNNERDAYSSDFDPATLPEPATSTTASAQNTANEAYTLANDAYALAENYTMRKGELTISEGNSSGTVTFDEAEEDNDYIVLLNAKDYYGSITVDATLIIEKVYTVDDFTVTTNAAPGTGNSVTFDWTLIRIKGQQ